MPDLIYLASPYSHSDPDVREQRFREACAAAAVLLRHGIHVFSPIAHTHPIAEYGLPQGWDFWEAYDRLYLNACAGMIVLMLPGWEESVGVQAEIAIMREQCKSITYISAPIYADDTYLLRVHIEAAAKLEVLDA